MGQFSRPIQEALRLLMGVSLIIVTIVDREVVSSRGVHTQGLLAEVSILG